MKQKEKNINITRFIAIYFVFGILWILFSDLLLFSSTTQTSSNLFQWGMVKGLLFILLTSVVIFIVLKKFSTKLKQSNIEIQRTNNLYKALIEQSAEGIFRIELKEPFLISLPVNKQIEHYTKDAIIVECNDAMAKMYGYSNAKEMQGLKLSSFIEKSFKRTENLKAFIESGYKIVDLESIEMDNAGNKKYF